MQSKLNQNPKKYTLPKRRNFFESNAGPEELEHAKELLDELREDELAVLFEKLGIKFFTKPGEKVRRRDYEIVVDETDREDFYREYRKIIKAKKKPSSNEPLP